MGKRYYCDYCDKSFADNAQNRKKHMQGVQHQSLMKMHYLAFKGEFSMTNIQFTGLGFLPDLSGFTVHHCTESYSLCKNIHLVWDKVQLHQALL